MDTSGTQRIETKDVETSIIARICEDFNLTPVLARAYYRQMAQYFAEFGEVPQKPGEICYLAVSAEEVPGKALKDCHKVEVRLELAVTEDAELLGEDGLAALRRRRISRLTRQARVQGALLTVEDLAYLTTSSVATVKRDLTELRSAGESVPTRGQIRDMGPRISHKAEAVKLYLWGFQFTEIERRISHSEGAISRYIQDFKQVAALHVRGATVPEIQAATTRSARLIAEYIGLYERAKKEFPAAPRLQELLDPKRAEKMT